jgi:hypothetical protein
MNRRDIIKGAVGAAFVAGLSPVEALILHGGAASAGTHDLILNIGQVTYADNQQMFINVLKQCGANGGISAWSTLTSAGADSNEEQYLPQILNSSGYPTSLTLTTPPTGGQQFTKLLTSSLRNLSRPPTASGPYPAGNYRLAVQGAFTIIIGGDFAVPSQTAPSGITITGNTITGTNAAGVTSYITLNCATATAAGLQIILTAAPSGSNPAANFTCCQSSLATSLDAGNVFHPNFLAFLQQVPWKALRFMDSLYINGSVLTANFASDPQASTALPALSAAWGGTSGQRRTTLSTGEELLVTFTAGSTAVTSTANPTITATTANFWYYAYDSWAGRAQLADFTYATNRGIPYEIVLGLCNVLGCSPWINVPAQLQAADWASFASLVVSTNTTGKKAFIEFYNEPWNGNFQTYHLLLAKSIKLWGGSGDPGSYIGMTVAQLADQIATTAGNPGFDNGFIILMPGQAASTGWAVNGLKATSWTGNTPPWQRVSASGQKTIKGVCIAPYAGQGPIYAADFTLMQAQPDGGYTDFLAQLTQNPVPSGNTYHDNNGNVLPSGGWFASAATWVTNHVTALAPYGALPIYCYEGSWQFDDPNNTHGQDTFLMTAARDARMASIQQIYFRTMAAAGCTPAQYNFCYGYSNASGTANAYQWGVIESPMQTSSPLSSTPARWQGAVNYVNNG